MTPAKKLKSCIFTFDMDTSFYIDWKNQGDDNLIIQNKDLLVKIINENMESFFTESTVIKNQLILLHQLYPTMKK